MVQENRAIALVNPASPYVEAYKKLQLNIQLSSVDKKIQVIQITSSQASEGKTLTAVNLSAVYAMKNKKVLVVDLDFRKPKVHQVFKLHNEKGIVDVLGDEVSLDDAIIHHESNVDVLLRGNKSPNIELTLESEKLATIFEELRNRYDIIILDCPPTMVVTDASLITKLSDGLVFVVAYNQTKKDAVKDSVKRLKNAGANVLGVVMTQMNKKMGKSYYANGYDYYNAYHEGGND